GADALPLLLDAGASDQLATPHRANALRLAAMHQRHAGDTADAVATLGQLEQLVGRDGLTDAELLWLADHHLREDRPDTAIAYAKPVAEGRPGARAGARAEALYVIGQARRHQGQLDEAVARLEAALAVGSDFDERAHLELARARRAG